MINQMQQENKIEEIKVQAQKTEEESAKETEGKEEPEAKAELKAGEGLEAGEKPKIGSREEELESKRTTSGAAKRVAAVVGVFLLLALVIATLIVACIEFAGKEQVFLALLLCDIVVPVFLWFILRFVSL